MHFSTSSQNQEREVLDAKYNPKGLRIQRRFTKEGVSPYDQFEYKICSSVIKNPDGKVIFQMDNVEVPKDWSQVATDILAQKYFRKAGVPQPDGSLGSETSVKQVVHRLAVTWKRWGERYGYFASPSDAQAFYDELVYMLLNQMAAPNSPQWFNTGLYEVYGIAGKPQGHYYVDPETEEVKESDSAYKRPQPHACFILSVEDDLVNPGGIMDLWVREARIFKYGSGVGTNFSNIRAEGEKLSGGGTSSGLMSFLLIGDRAAGAIKSGGTTRRAAKMVIVDIDHPEIMEFINWKVNEEKKVAALIKAGYSADYEGEAYRTVSGQNSNNSVRIPNEFFNVLAENGNWHCTARTTGEVMRVYKAQELWDAIAKAAWQCADPGVQFHTTINEWHTCPEAGPIRASNPCSEYMFLDNTACNLASLNLRKFFDPETKEFHIEDFQHAVRLWTIVLEISVLMAHFPSKEVAQLSYAYRTLGLGYANLGSLLMVWGIPYDSERARAIAGAITAIMTATAYATSAEMAAFLGPFKDFPRNREAMLRVIRNHRRAAYNQSDYEQLSIKPVGIDPRFCPEALLNAARKSWDVALELGEKFGYRNAQVSVIAPTGTIGLLMDCDTTGIEPDFALVKFKKLAGGGYFKIINNSVPVALKSLGYSDAAIQEIVHYVIGHGTLKDAPGINHEVLLKKGFTHEDLQNIEAQLPNAIDIQHVFSPWVLGEETMKRLGVPEALWKSDKPFNLLQWLGFSPQEIEAANAYVCGTMCIEGAPHLKEEHLPIFDTANKNGKRGQRYIHPHGHIRMMAAVQPFISGAISKTINLPNEATWQEIQECYMLAWRLGLKAISIYRDGSKLSQPLSAGGTDADSTSTLLLNGNATHHMSPDQVIQLIKKVLSKENGEKIQLEIRRLVGRRELPPKRRGFTQKAKVGGQTIFLRTGEYEDGTLGEIFIDMHKEGATLRSLLNCFAIAVSIGLQYGVPLEEFVDKFAFTRFEPSGPVDHPNIKYATSILDYIFRLLAFEYLGRTDLVQVAPSPEEQLTQRYKEIPKSTNPSHSSAPFQSFMEQMMGDAPACNVCGHITIRSGTCYRCLNCGNSMGCS